ncbi:probable zinc metalloprotease EGY2, chloroplastic [Olea europaea var. sylvestris]|uniref:probable zinc metalloprotease EGY2, chloroplastic n=1 Tax=Olea europaea var. sylvestris TaxID=158386 RepID=UPI000C1CF2B6|nr:probable zinc metalloprotease EGY2, chloroplastic [Olea europaea var. sylvestris]
MKFKSSCPAVESTSWSILGSGKLSLGHVLFKFDKFGDQYKLFLLINPEDDKPVAVVVPRKTLQPEATAVPEWFAAGAFGLVTIFTLLLRNVPALQANVLSIFDNIELLEYGLPGALVTALPLAVHEISHALVAKEIGIKLGMPYFVPSWQVRNIVILI